MDIEKVVKKSERGTRRYEYFKSLGYGEKSSQLLAILPYGDSDLSFFLKDFDLEARLDKLYAWLLERPENTPMEAISNEARKKRYPEEDGFRGTGHGGGSRFFGAMSAIPKLFSGSLKESVYEEGASAPMASPNVSMKLGFAPEMPPESMSMSEKVMALGTMMQMAQAAPEPEVSFDAMEIDDCEAGGVESEEMLSDLQEKLSTDAYAQIEEKDAKSVLTAPTSTFRMTTTTSSMGILLNQIRNGRHVDLSQVRIEEVLNYFDYEHGPWEDGDAKFRISTERLGKTGGKELLYINVEASDRAKEHQNVILLLDVSGSMSSQSDVTLETIATVVSKLKEGDVLSLVTYSSRDETVFADHVIAGQGDKEDIMGRILGIEITGCTWGSAGIETAYELGQKVYKKDWSNQVILITDGDLNFGITKKDGLQELIEEKKKTGLFLSVIGTGLYNYQDEKLEVLSKHGNGTYCVVNALEDVEYSVNKRYVSLTNVVAKDVKAQVEFNPKFVKTYRLLGYENRSLSHEDFKNDKVISEPYGAGGHGVAVYELELGDATAQQELKYQQAVAVPSDELCTVKVRFKDPLGEESEEISKAVLQGEGTEGGLGAEGCGSGAEGADDASKGKNARLAYFLYCLSEKLRGSDKLDEADEAFFAEMVKDKKYAELASGNSELDRLVAFVQK